jgi:hypothetical protein
MPSMIAVVCAHGGSDRKPGHRYSVRPNLGGIAPVSTVTCWVTDNNYPSAMSSVAIESVG